MEWCETYGQMRHPDCDECKAFVAARVKPLDRIKALEAELTTVHDDLRAARAELASMKHLNAHRLELAEQAAGERIKAEAERDALRDALKEYGRHEPSCEWWTVARKQPDTCDCGYTKAISE